MLFRWRLKHKLTVLAALLCVTLALLAASGFRGAYAYRGLARSVSRRAAELPVASELQSNVNDLRVTLSRTRQLRQPPQGMVAPPIDTQLLREEFRTQFLTVQNTLENYESRLTSFYPSDTALGDHKKEEAAVAEIKASLLRIEQLNQGEAWMMEEVAVDQIALELTTLSQLTDDLPGYLQKRMHNFAGEVRTQYRTWIVLTWASSLMAIAMLFTFARSAYVWVLYPLRKLLKGSSIFAEGNYDHRIEIKTRGEMATLARILNEMAQNFHETEESLKTKVKQRTKEVNRSERLASVGFLAAGVAHEINNPLASIAISAESLQERLSDIIQNDDALGDDQHNPEIGIVRDYLRMIQDEAFRCKQITERLLDFSRMSDVEKEDTDMGKLVESMIDLISHLGNYKHKTIDFENDTEILASVNPQEIKQVILNLLTNSLDSLDAGGIVHVELAQINNQVELLVRDNGCGMSDDVQEHLFEPFFTRRRDGSGTGLGLSITYRIIADHGGEIEASSDGLGKGSQFRVLLPAATKEKRITRSNNAA